ncbi:MAG: prepilin-type N-terminal cleavage/methylation domain-containing protein [Clostridia bacterium]|nr:prepilin-type N-terminal cleavage/methylation domain-containing protein [Clostridia bacterium]
MKTKGFTLVELLVVIAILAILATVSVVGYTSYIKNANESVALQEMTQVRSSIKAEDILNGNFAISGGKVALTTGKDTSNEELAAFVTELNKTLKNGQVQTIADQSANIVYKSKDGTITATWDLVTDAITVQ